MRHVGTVPLETGRLTLRRFAEEDASAAFRNWTSDAQVTRFLTWPAHENIEVTQSVLKSWTAQYERPDYYHWAIVLKETRQPIGSISAVRIDEGAEKIRIGYCIGRRWWHCGYMSEALTALIAFFFEQVGAGRLEAQHDPENPHSGGVMRKCGMTYEGTLRRAERSNRGIVDACVYGILASDYFGK